MKRRLAATLFGTALVVSTAASAATLEPVTGSASVKIGDGFQAITSPVKVEPGDTIMVSPNGSAKIVYAYFALSQPAMSGIPCIFVRGKLDLRGAMFTSEQLIAFVKNGRSIQVAKGANNRRLISILDRRGRVKSACEIPRDLYQGLMEETVDALARRHGTDLRVDINRDFYGVTCASVRSGLFGWRTSRLGIAPRHILMLQNALDARAMTEDAI